MQVTVERPNPCKVELKIEIEPERVAKAINEAYKDFSKITQVPGFRKGKAPRRLLESYVSLDSVKQRAAEQMVGPAYQEAIEKEDIHPYAEPSVDIEQFEDDKPFIFKAAIPLAPSVELGDYKGIKAERKVHVVTDEDVDAQLKYLQESRATSSPVEGRGVQNGDVVIAEVATTIEGQEKNAPKRSMIQVGSNVPSFDENLIGMVPEETKTFTVEYPADYHDAELAGKKSEIQLQVESIRERNIPELNDEFAKTFGDVETLDALRADMKTRMETSAEETADREVEHNIIDEIVSKSTVCIPDVLIEHEMGHDIEDLQKRLSHQGVSVAQYLQQTGKSQEDFIKELRESSESRVKIGLVLGEIVDAEKISVSDEEVDAEIDRIAAESNATRESVETFMETRGGKGTLKNNLLNKKIMDYLKSVSKIKQ